MAEADEERRNRTRAAAGAERRERLAAAMRENLKRRKAQARGRALPEPPAEPVEEG